MMSNYRCMGMTFVIGYLCLVPMISGRFRSRIQSNKNSQPSIFIQLIHVSTVLGLSLFLAFTWEIAGPGGSIEEVIKRFMSSAKVYDPLDHLHMFRLLARKNTRIPRIQMENGNVEFRDLKTTYAVSDLSGWNPWRTSGIRVEVMRISVKESRVHFSASPTSLFFSARPRLLTSSTVRSSQSSICSSYLNPEVHPFKEWWNVRRRFHWQVSIALLSPRDLHQPQNRPLLLVFSIQSFGKSSRSSS